MKSARQKPSTVPHSGNGATPESRAERLARIKQEIQNGTYDTDEKLDLAIEKMLGRWKFE